MIGFLRGQFARCTPTSLLMDVNGVGYRLSISLHTYEDIKKKKEGMLFTHLHVSDTAHKLYGFSSEEEKEMFSQLLSVGGVGPSTAMLALSSFSVQQLKEAISANDIVQVQQIKGVGKKTAQRILLELSDKMGDATAHAEQQGGHFKLLEETLQALVALGIPKSEARKKVESAWQQHKKEGMVLEEMIKLSLKDSAP